MQNTKMKTSEFSVLEYEMAKLSLALNIMVH